MIRILSAAGLALLLSSAATAQTTERDLAVVGRALSFLEGASGSDRTVAIVYDPASQAEAEALNSAMAGGLSAGRVTLSGQLVPLGQSVSGVDAAMFVGGAASDAGAVQAATSAGVMTVSTDMACVQAGNCVMGVQSEPSVRIVVNNAAASSASVSFSTAFAMMVEEI